MQFRAPMPFRVIRKLDWTTSDGRCWLNGYVRHEAKGQAVARR
ncbi:hypothetical protein [Micromonospora tarapacensis]|nr:hypothetical protein [Micromonospora tarapacensis]